MHIKHEDVKQKNNDLFQFYFKYSQIIYSQEV